jgi:hypothetical protein
MKISMYGESWRNLILTPVSSDVALQKCGVLRHFGSPLLSSSSRWRAYTISSFNNKINGSVEQARRAYIILHLTKSIFLTFPSPKHKIVMKWRLKTMTRFNLAALLYGTRRAITEKISWRLRKSSRSYTTEILLGSWSPSSDNTRVLQFYFFPHKIMDTRRKAVYFMWGTNLFSWLS